jgi:hypothetical protein
LEMTKYSALIRSLWIRGRCTQCHLPYSHPNG